MLVTLVAVIGGILWLTASFSVESDFANNIHAGICDAYRTLFGDGEK